MTSGRWSEPREGSGPPPRIADRSENVLAGSAVSDVRLALPVPSRFVPVPGTTHENPHRLAIGDGNRDTGLSSETRLHLREDASYYPT